MLFVGVDWAEDHHDVCVMDDSGRVIVGRRVGDDPGGLAAIHQMVAEAGGDGPDPMVVVGIETDRGLLVRGLVGSGYELYAVNPKSVDRYRDRHRVSGAKSDRADAKLLADLVRTDRHNHRPVAGDSDLAGAIGALSRAHKALIWSRQREVAKLRAVLHEFYPQALGAFGELHHPDALAVLAKAPGPDQGRRLTHRQLVTALGKGGRKRSLEGKAADYHQTLTEGALPVPEVIAAANSQVVTALVAVISTLNTQIGVLQTELGQCFSRHPDTEIILSLPGLGNVLGARVLAEFGDDPNRYTDPKARKAYAGTAPITRASGHTTTVTRRWARNPWLVDACQLWAFASLSSSPGARRYYDTLRVRGKGHHQALRQLANRWVGILHGCLHHRQRYQEHIAWAQPQTQTPA